MTVKIVVLGSISNGPYEVLVPHPFDEKKFHGTLTEHEEAYQIARQVFEPAIDAADAVVVWAPDGLKPGSHTARDVEYAISNGKNVVFIDPAQGWRK